MVEIKENDCLLFGKNLQEACLIHFCLQKRCRLSFYITKLSLISLLRTKSSNKETEKK